MKKRRQKIIKLINNIFSVFLLIVSDLIFSVTFYIIKVFKDINFYQVIYLFLSDTKGTSPIMIINGIKTCAIFFIVLLIILILPIISFKRINIYLETKNKKKKINILPNIFSKYKIIYGFIILFLSVFVLLKTVKFDQYISVSKEKGDLYETYYVNANNVDIKFPNKKRNLILIYLESMESSLASIELGGGFIDSRIPELENLALNNLNFSNNDKIGGSKTLTITSFTIAATVASTSGTPILAEIGNNYSEVDKFMPEVRTMGDILKNEGYNLELIQGSAKEFSGIDKYFGQHGNYKIFDYNTARERKYIKKDYYTWWGFEDSKLFKYAKKEIEDLSKKDEPFAVTMFTMDTHATDGYLDKSCPSKFKDKMSNVFACSSKMVNEFVEWLKEQDFYENTTIVIIGDHTTMQNEYFKDLPDFDRSAYNVFINSAIEVKNNKNRKFTSFDLFPTILASLGAEIKGNQLGFGMNLFSGKETLLEKLTLDTFNEELAKPSNYYKTYLSNNPNIEVSEDDE